MKVRSGFISNSSSSSFIIFKDYLTKDQIDQIRDRERFCFSQEYFEKAKAWYREKYPDRSLPDFLKRNTPEIQDEDYEWDIRDDWDVQETRDLFEFSTAMDNFDMEQFLEIIGVTVEKCGLYLENPGAYEKVLGLNDARTDLKNYSNDKYFFDHYDDDYFYTSDYYRDVRYPQDINFRDEFMSSHKAGWMSDVVDPKPKKKWICEDAGQALKEVEHKIRELSIKNGAYCLDKMSNGEYYDEKCRLYAEVLASIEEVKNNWQAVDDFEED